uniref:Uncharacterized protein n=1 Tax=Oryza meridionalis TaxID=40149 RepID=A0A0E0DAN0_9ORYZ
MKQRTIWLKYGPHIPQVGASRKRGSPATIATSTEERKKQQRWRTWEATAAASHSSPTAIGVRGEAAATAGGLRVPRPAARAECAGRGSGWAVPDLPGEAEAESREVVGARRRELAWSSICI